MPRPRPASVIATAAAATSIAAAAIAQAPATFNRVSKFPVFLNTSVETTTSAEIVAATEDGNTLVYSDSPGKTVGFIDITDPAQPLPGGSLSIDGEPTCVAILGQTALVAVNTSPSFVMPSGLLLVIDVPSRAILRTIHQRPEATELHVTVALAMLLVQAWADSGGTDEGLHALMDTAAEMVRELPARVAEC